MTHFDGQKLPSPCPCVSHMYLLSFVRRVLCDELDITPNLTAVISRRIYVYMWKVLDSSSPVCR